MAKEAHLEMSFRPNVELVSLVRRFVADFYSHVLEDTGSTTSRLALATHELLENAVKYSSTGETLLTLSVANHDGGAGRATIVASNRASGERIEELRALLDEMRDWGDADAFFLELMRRSVRRPTGSGLGLARIHAEAELSLAYKVEGDRVTVTAHTDIPTAEGV